MNLPIIDAHIHIDKYDEETRSKILRDMSQFNVIALIAVSWDLESARKIAALGARYKSIKPAFGFHPEQPLPSQEELKDLLAFINTSKDNMVAIGEVGLPHYLRREDPTLDLQPYIAVLETFIKMAKKIDIPIILHAIYGDAPVVCDLLEKHNITKAHFHWFKGDKPTIKRMITNDYFISITPDVLYTPKIQQLVINYPLELMMVETDGPWSFSGPFENELTHPKMIHKTIQKIAELKKMELSSVYSKLFKNTKTFYGI